MTAHFSSCPEKEGQCLSFPFSSHWQGLGPWTEETWWYAVFNIPGHGEATSWEEFGSSTPPKVQICQPDLYVRNFHFVSAPDVGRRVSVYSSLAPLPLPIPVHLQCQDACRYKVREGPSSSCVQLQSPNSMRSAFPRAGEGLPGR